MTQASCTLKAAARILAFAGCLVASAVFAAAGDPDLSFGTAGQASIVPAGGSFTARAIVAQPDGKIALAGVGIDFNAPGFGLQQPTFAFERLLPDGQVEKFVHPSDLFYGFADALAVQPDGKYVLAGAMAGGCCINIPPVMFTVARFLPDGTLDSSFGPNGNGVVSLQMPSAVTHVGDVAIQSDGSILVAMGVLDTNPYLAQDFYVFRFTPQGNLDTSYGIGGRIGLAASATSTAKPRLALLPDGRAIFAADAFCDPLINCALVVRLLPDGSEDPTYGNHDPSGQPGYIDRTHWALEAIALQPDGKVLFTAGQNALLRLTADGMLDPSFGGVGAVSLADSNTLQVHTVAVQPDGRIVVGGNTMSGTTPANPMFMRLHADGSIDQSVQGTGMAVGPTLGAVAADLMALQPDGNILLGGTASRAIDRLLGSGGYDVFSDSTKFARQQFRDFLAREGDPQGVAYWAAQIDSGASSRGQVVESFLASPEFQGTIAPVARLYFAYFLRVPDYQGINFWISYFRAGNSLQAISDQFAASGEFQSRYGALDNTGFVNLVYQNVLGRAPDAGGLAFWVGELDSGRRTRGQVMLGFSESAEYMADSNAEVYVTMAYIGMLRRVPDAGGFAFWVDYLDQGNSGLALIDGLLGSPEYHARFLP